MTTRSQKIRYGLILQACVREALKRSSFSAFVSNPNVHQQTIQPDFLIPDLQSPKWMIEVTQTDSRDAFRMKTLRYFEAICEAKVHFGSELICVNIFWGLPSTDIPQRNIDALFGFFDVNFLPKEACKTPLQRKLLEELEVAAFQMALEKSSSSVESVFKAILSSHEKALGILAGLLDTTLAGSHTQELWKPFWKVETQRESQLQTLPFTPENSRNYKKSVLQTLFLTEAHWKELLKNPKGKDISKELEVRLVSLGCAQSRRTLRGDSIVLDGSFRELLVDRQVQQLRKLCIEHLLSNPAMHDFFADIWEPQRCLQMAKAFLHCAKQGGKALGEALLTCLTEDNAFEVSHHRCWIADLMPLAAEESHNAFNRRMYRHADYHFPLGNPFNYLAIRSSRLGSDVTFLRKLVSIATHVFFESLQEKNLNLQTLSEALLVQRLQSFRMEAAIKLQKLNPLHLLIKSVATELGLSCDYGGVRHLFSDRSAYKSAPGAIRLFRLSHENGSEILINTLSVDIYGGLDKAKEWAARGRMLRYHNVDGKLEEKPWKLLLLLDGPWKKEAVLRLQRAGWSICRVDDFRETLTGWI